jgi:RNA polymerase sigma-70 factor (ECF subfamily)
MWEEFQTSASFLSQLRDTTNTEAWTRFVKMYQPGILASCRRLGMGLQDAEDLSQEVLLKIVKAMPGFRYDPNKRFRGWLLTVLRRAAFDFLEKNRNRGDRPAGGTDAHEAQGQVPDPYAQDPATLSESFASDAFLQILLLEAKKRVKARVKPNRWASFAGRYEQDKSTTEVAAALGESVAYVGTAAAEVLEMVRKEFEKLRQEEGDGSPGP